MPSHRKTTAITTSAPGRICMFGEHQDYLSLSVITAAIDLRIRIQGKAQRFRRIDLSLPDIHDQETIDLSVPVEYKKERDYLRSGLNVFLRQGLLLPSGYRCEIRGQIPINSGTSSSSAMMVAWIGFLLTAAGDPRQKDPLTVARLAHEAEVLEFKEPGGMMDHFAASFGSILYIDFHHPSKPIQLDQRLGSFVLGDSLEPKDTKGILSRVKDGTLSALRRSNSSLHTLQLESLHKLNSLNHEEIELLKGNIINKELTQKARVLFSQGRMTDRILGQMLTQHHVELRDRLKISTQKIECMIDAAMKAGALGAKINGSGGGGCMFAYAPDSAEEVAESIRRSGGKAYVVHIGPGFTVEEGSC